MEIYVLKDELVDELKDKDTALVEVSLVLVVIWLFDPLSVIDRLFLAIDTGLFIR